MHADLILKYNPELIMISAGFDAHELDPLGHMNVTGAGFGDLTRTCQQLAEETCSGRLVSMLEGGYSLDGLVASTVEHLNVLGSG